MTLPRPISQRDPRWASLLLGTSGLTVGSQGCVVTCCSYDLTRAIGRDITPAELVPWLNTHGGFTNGLLYWRKIDEFSKGKLRYWALPVGKRFTLIRGQFKPNDRWFQHWIALIPGTGMCMEPWRGQFRKIDPSWFRPDGRRVYFR
jgi:hypothetical protein